MFRVIKSIFSRHKEVVPQYTEEEKLLLKVVENCQRLMDNNVLGVTEARQFMVKLPTHYFKSGHYNGEVHHLCNECHKKLWEYCRIKNFIDDISYEEFTEHGMIHFKSLSIENEQFGKAD